MYQKQQELELIARYKGKTPAVVKKMVREDILRRFPNSLLAVMASNLLYRCNSWKQLDDKIHLLLRFAQRDTQNIFMDDLYWAYQNIRSDDRKHFALKKRTDKQVGFFTECPHCWRFVFKRYNKIKKNPYCIFHKPGTSEYQRNRRALLRSAKKSILPRVLELRSHYIEKTIEVIRPQSINILLQPKIMLDPKKIFPAEYDLMRIWPHLPLTKEFIRAEGGDLQSISSVVSTLDPVERVDPLDIWDENDEEGAAFVRQKRLLLHQIFILDASIFKHTLCLAEAWLALQKEIKASKGGKRSNSGGRRKGAGRPLKPVEE